MGFLIVVGVFAVIFVGWALIKVAPWSAPLSGSVGLAIFFGSLYGEYFRGEMFGGGLFLFSVLMFVLGGGMRNG